MVDSVLHSSKLNLSFMCVVIKPATRENLAKLSVLASYELTKYPLRELGAKKIQIHRRVSCLVCVIDTYEYNLNPVVFLYAKY